MLNETTRRLFELQKLKGVGPATIEQVARRNDVHTLTIDDIASAYPKISKALEVPNAWNSAIDAAERDLEAASKIGARILCVLDQDYPKLLAQVRDRPFFLYVRGNLAKEPERSVAIIGTRTPTEHGKVVTERIAEYLSTNGWSIVSGLALGCDVIAHRTALSNGGHTVAILAHGLHTVAPKQHARLSQEIIDSGGALLTEYGFGIEPFPHQFVKRDRIQAGLAAGVVMIQSDIQGGSLHASRAAIEYKRALCIASATERDIANNEPKIGANVLLAGTDDRSKCELLKCEAAELDNLVVIRNRDDYPNLLKSLEKTPSHTSQELHFQKTLL